MDSPEVKRVYVGNFSDEQLPRNASLQKISDLSQRARRTLAHALLLEHLRSAMPSLWGLAEKQKELIDSLPQVYREVARQHGVPLGDFPDVDAMREKLCVEDFTKFRRLDRRKVENLKCLLSKDIPSLLAMVEGERTGGSK